MKKSYVTLLVLSLFLTSCSVIEWDEPILFLEKHGNSIWERVDKSGSNQNMYMKISNKPDKIAALFGSTVQVCYNRILYGDGFEINIGSNTEDHLEFEQRNAKDMNQDQISLDIRNDTLIQIGYTGNAHGYYNWARTWVRSEVNVEDLKLCD